MLCAQQFDRIQASDLEPWAETGIEQAADANGFPGKSLGCRISSFELFAGAREHRDRNPAPRPKTRPNIKDNPRPAAGCARDLAREDHHGARSFGERAGRSRIKDGIIRIGPQAKLCRAGLRLCGKKEAPAALRRQARIIARKPGIDKRLCDRELRCALAIPVLRVWPVDEGREAPPAILPGSGNAKSNGASAEPARELIASADVESGIVRSWPRRIGARDLELPAVIEREVEPLIDRDHAGADVPRTRAGLLRQAAAAEPGEHGQERKAVPPAKSAPHRRGRAWVWFGAKRFTRGGHEIVRAQMFSGRQPYDNKSVSGGRASALERLGIFTKDPPAQAAAKWRRLCR